MDKEERIKQAGVLLGKIIDLEEEINKLVSIQAIEEASALAEIKYQCYDQLRATVTVGMFENRERLEKIKEELRKETGMQGINSLYREYFQKSRIFLYPALEIKKGVSITPIQTHISWDEGGYTTRDKKLLCLYHMRNDKEYLEFERTKLKGNKLFEKLIHAEGEPPKGVYIFNFDQHDKDWNMFLKGRYSKMSPELKKKIKDFFRPSGNNYVYIESFLHPEKYYSIYSEMLGVSIDTLKSVGELTSPPDLEREALKIAVKNINKVTK